MTDSTAPLNSSGGNLANNKRRGLGRGLGALLGRGEDAPVSDVPASGPTDETPLSPDSTASNGALRDGVRQVTLSQIVANPRQPRTIFEEQALIELAASISEHGILQPLIVTADPQHSGQFWLIAGERRWRAAHIANLPTVPVIVREASSQQLVEWALIENVQRADLNALEEAAAYHSLMSEFGLTQAEVAKRVGRSRSAVANTVRLLQLPTSAQKALSENRISEGHARALLGLPGPSEIEQMLLRVMAQNLSVRQTELAVQQWLEIRNRPPVPPKPAPPAASDEVTHLETRFRNAFGTKVNLNRNADGSGKLVVHFFNDDDLDTIYRLIVRDENE